MRVWERFSVCVAYCSDQCRDRVNPVTAGQVRGS